MAGSRNNPELTMVAEVLISAAILVALMLLLPEYTVALLSLGLTPLLLAVAISRQHIRKGLGSPSHIFITLLLMVVYTLYDFFMENTMRISHSGQEYAMWHYAAIGASITTVLAFLIALPDISRKLKTVFMPDQHRNTDR